MSDGGLTLFPCKEPGGGFSVLLRIYGERCLAKASHSFCVHMLFAGHRCVQLPRSAAGLWTRTGPAGGAREESGPKKPAA